VFNPFLILYTREFEGEREREREIVDRRLEKKGEKDREKES
jgi:hypothetical protein